MKLTKLIATKATINEEGTKLIESFQNYTPKDLLSGFDKERAEELGIPFTPEPYPFELDNDGYLIMDKHLFDYEEYEIEFFSFSHIEKRDDVFIFVTLDGTQHVISKKQYKKLMGKSKTK